MTRTIRKGILAASCLAFCILLSGCWDRTELNELAITSATSFDKTDKGWTISYQIIIPSAISSGYGGGGAGSSGSPITVYSTTGKTIREAVSRSVMESPRELYFAHNRVLVVSDRAARSGMNAILDVYFRLPEARETVNILISEGDPSRIISQLFAIQRISGEGLQALIAKESRIDSILPAVKVYEFAMSIVGDGRSGVLPEIYIGGSPDVNRTDQLSKTSLTARLKLGRLALFKADRMVGWLNQREALGVSFIADRIKSATFAFPCVNRGQTEQLGTFRITKSSTKLVPRRAGERLTMDVRIRTEGALEEMDCALDLLEPSVLQQLEARLKEEIDNIVDEAWKAVKMHKADVLGFAEAVHRHDPKYWKSVKNNWDEAFASIALKTDIKMKIERVGVSTKTFKKLEEQENE
ncbi:Ger(x)C family spore germination protein [Cohnella hashimotonis]|uniref:Ger(X)C family spore germination protein n=1 Tax=Cohnella hashimotonis TaxID=2826895 RepID=A0ABT6TDT8_9BACL|nr:Ger(x)C family spore germination protein [Cohnella hashimotonis]MDI4644498.1 Ger(x)C family spore germination protein [Cohnella hashimotonis]